MNDIREGSHPTTSRLECEEINEIGEGSRTVHFPVIVFC